MKATTSGIPDKQTPEYFFPELIFLDRDYADTTDFFSSIFRELRRHDYVRDSFLSAIIQREQDYPTALPTEPFAIAVPHTNPEHIIRPFISITRLNHSILWREMGNDENDLQASIIVLLGFVDQHSHLQLLQKLMECFTDKSFLTRLREIATAKEVICTLKDKLHI